MSVLWPSFCIVRIFTLSIIPLQTQAFPEVIILCSTTPVLNTSCLLHNVEGVKINKNCPILSLKCTFSHLCRWFLSASLLLLLAIAALQWAPVHLGGVVRNQAVSIREARHIFLARPRSFVTSPHISPVLSCSNPG